MAAHTRRLILLAGVLAVLSMALGVTLWKRRFHHYTPAAAVRDLEAAAKAHGAERPVDRYLEVRYGSMSEASNRQAALVDFFNIGHIDGLYLIVSRLDAPRKDADIIAMAQWIRDYRTTMSAEEKAVLKTYFLSDAGRTRIREATKNYMAKDVRFRADTASVIQELMTTVAVTQR